MQKLDALRVPLKGGLVEASAGTGKTYTITTLVLRLLLEAERNIDEILVVTFTRAATAELGERIRSRINEALAAFQGRPSDDPILSALVHQSRDKKSAEKRLAEAIANFDTAAIFTIHGFCQRVLSRHALESGERFDAELVADQEPLLEELVFDFWARSLYNASPAWVRRVIEADLLPDKLLEIADLSTRDPTMPLLPEAPTPSMLETAAELFEKRRKEAAAIWHEARAAIEEELASRSKYQSGWLKGWYTQMDRLLGSARPGSSTLFDKFDRFTSAKLAEATKKGKTTPNHPFFAACDRLHEAALALEDAADQRMIAFQRELIDYIRREAPRRKEAARIQSFDDLLHRLDRALSSEGGAALAAALRGSYKAALIDEFQDTDPVQYRIFSAIYPNTSAGSLFLIGDPKQAIYSFRGADVFAYLNAARDDTKARYTLETNYRSDPGVVAATNALFSRHTTPFLLGGIDFREAAHAPKAAPKLAIAGKGASPLRLLFVSRERAREDENKPISKGFAERFIPAAIASDIVRLLASGATIEGRALGPADIAVLVRKNKQAHAMQAALRALGVPSVQKSDASVFDAPEALELQELLGAMIDPQRAGALRSALATSLFGLHADEIAALEQDDIAWDRWMARFGALHERLREWGFVAAWKRLLDEEGVAARLLALTDGERRLTNFLHLAELLHQAATREHRGPMALYRWLSTMRADPRARARLGGESAELRLESDDAAVKLVTIHKSKGLEYPIVYCPYLWDGKLPGKDTRGPLRFHDPEDEHKLKLDLGSGHFGAHLSAARREAAAENLRLCYVAMTRAKHQCSVVWGNFNDAGSSALAYLLHGPGDDEGDPLEATARRVSAMNDESLKAELSAFAEAAGASLSELEPPSERRYTPPIASPAKLESRQIHRTLESRFRTSSFSGLVRSGSAFAQIEVEGRDRDEEPQARAAKADEAKNADQVVLADFPGGARVGELLHKIFELIDFTAPRAAIEGTVESELDRFGLAQDPWREVLSRAIGDVLSTPMAAPGQRVLRLGEVQSARRLSELEFVFPTKDQLITSRAVSEVFARHPEAPLPREYADKLARLPFQPFEGFLRGYIDLVFEHEGRFYVADYKSNFLGRASSDYGAAALLSSMTEHHYVLQYHLYLVALHRYLSHRMPKYDYDSHMGGVFYMFLRGMSPERGVNAGVFADRPPRARIQALSALFSAPKRSGKGASK